jgi:hypothetical protein
VGQGEGAMLRRWKRRRQRAQVRPARCCLRKQLATDVVIAESRHEAVEEQFFRPMVRAEVLHGGPAGRPGDGPGGRCETAAGCTDLDEMVDRLVPDRRKHVDYEQNVMRPEVRAAVSAERLTEIGEKRAEA